VAACACGATITWGVTEQQEKVPLDAVASYAGDGRYRVIDFERSPWLVEPVTAKAQTAAYADHRRACPRR
jgi:hypothetical protein